MVAFSFDFVWILVSRFVLLIIGALGITVHQMIPPVDMDERGCKTSRYSL